MANLGSSKSSSALVGRTAQARSKALPGRTSANGARAFTRGPGRTSINGTKGVSRGGAIRGGGAGGARRLIGASY